MESTQADLTELHAQITEDYYQISEYAQVVNHEK